MNYNNIDKAGGIESTQFSYLENDSISFAGVKNGRFWRYNFYGTYGVGYKDVPAAKKAAFDKVIDDMVVKDR